MINIQKKVDTGVWDETRKFVLGYKLPELCTDVTRTYKDVFKWQVNII